MFTPTLNGSQNQFSVPEEFSSKARDYVLKNLLQAKDHRVQSDEPLDGRTKRHLETSKSSASRTRSNVYENSLRRVPSASSVSTYASSQNSVFSSTSAASSCSFNERNHAPRTQELSLQATIGEIKAMHDKGPQNIGYSVFTQLNEAVQKSPQSRGPHLIDWNLNMLRLILITDTNSSISSLAGHRHPQSTQSELFNFWKSNSAYPRNSATLEKVVSPQARAVFQRKDCSPTVALQAIRENLEDVELVQEFVNLQLFEEFNLDYQFKLKVAQVSIERSRRLHSSATGPLPSQLRVIALKNYFLNLLVASQTLFEFYYTKMTILKGASIKDRVLWERIRTKNFNEVEQLND